MYRHGYVVPKSVVVQDIDAEEEDNINQPPADWYLVRGNEERWARRVELGDVAGDGYKKKLDKGEESSYKSTVSAYSRQYLG